MVSKMNKNAMKTNKRFIFVQKSEAARILMESTESIRQLIQSTKMCQLEARREASKQQAHEFKVQTAYQHKYWCTAIFYYVWGSHGNASVLVICLTRRSITLASPTDPMHAVEGGVCSRTCEVFHGVLTPTQRQQLDELAERILKPIRSSEKKHHHRIDFTGGFTSTTLLHCHEWCGVMQGLVVLLSTPEGQEITSAWFHDEDVDFDELDTTKCRRTRSQNLKARLKSVLIMMSPHHLLVHYFVFVLTCQTWATVPRSDDEPRRQVILFLFPLC